MKQLAICFSLVLAACGVEAPATTEGAAPASSVDSDRIAPEVLRCSAASPSPCANAAVGSPCVVGGRALHCLLAFDEPDGSVACLCQSQTTI